MPEHESNGGCEVCKKTAKQFCASCKSVFYCSKDCQKRGWKDHKTKCRPFSIQMHPLYGRYVIATRDIKPGEVILKEKPVCIGPKQKSLPMCLGCHNPSAGVKCPQCGYLLCNVNCQKYHKTECPILSKASAPISPTEEVAYSSIMALRCLLTKTHEPKTWEVINTLQDHLNEIQKGYLYHFFMAKVVSFLRDNLGYKEFDEATILKVCGVLTTNAYEIKHNGSRVRGLYDVASKFAHCCTPNTKHVIESDQTAVFYSTTKIIKGASITTNYTQILWNTMARRQHLKMLKFFMCSCPRCSDPTELGTHYSSMICSKCEGSLLSKDPLDLESIWSCAKCSHVMSAKQMRWGDAVICKEMREIDKNSPTALEEFLDKYKKTLHSQHRFFVEAKYALVRMYGISGACRYRDLTRNQLENKVKWCRELVALGDVIDPGLSLLRGTVLFELQAALVALAKNLLSNDVITNDGAKEYMEEAAEVLQEASLILKHEPEMRDGGLNDRLAKLSQELEM